MRKFNNVIFTSKILYLSFFFLVVFFYSCKQDKTESNFDKVLFYKPDILNNLNQNILSRLYDVDFFMNYFKASSIKDTNNYKGEIIIVKTKKNKILQISSMFYDGKELSSIPFYTKVSRKESNFSEPISIYTINTDNSDILNYYSNFILTYKADTCKINFYYLDKKKSFYLNNNNKIDSVICVFNDDLTTSMSYFCQKYTFFKVNSSLINSNEYEFEYYDNKDTLIDIDNFHKIKIVFNNVGNLVEEYFYNKQNQLKSNSKCFVKLVYDDRNRVIQEKKFNSSTNNKIDTSKYEICNYEYDANGNLIKIKKEYSKKNQIDTDDPIWNSLFSMGSETIKNIKEYPLSLIKDDTLLFSKKMYDNTGTLSLIEFYDSIQNKNRTIKWNYFFDDSIYLKETYIDTLLKSEEYYDKYNNRTTFYGYCKVIYEYDSLNRCTIEKNLDYSDRLLNNDQGYCSRAYQYDNENKISFKIFTNEDNLSVIYKFDKEGNEIKTFFYKPYWGTIEKIEKDGVLYFIPTYGKLTSLYYSQKGTLTDTMKINRSEIYIPDNSLKFEGDYYKFVYCIKKLENL